MAAIARPSRFSCLPSRRMSTNTFYFIRGHSSGPSSVGAFHFVPELCPRVMSQGTRSIYKSYRRIARLRSCGRLRLTPIPSLTDLDDARLWASWDGYLDSDHDNMGRARVFVWRFGPELTPGRLSFGHLAQLHLRAESLSNRAEWQALLEVVGDWYPQSSSAPRLKEWALTESASNLAHQLTAFGRLFVLSRLRRPSAYPEWRSFFGRRVLACVLDQWTGSRRKPE